MTRSTSTLTPVNQHTLRHPQAVAWLILLSGFATFCVIAALGTAGLRWFLFDSQIDLNARLTVSRGRIDLTMPDGSPSTTTSTMFVDPAVSVQVDSFAQGYLTFEDNYSEQVIATVFMLQGSTISLERNWRPRFEWGTHPYQIWLGQSAGRFVVEIPPGIGRGVFLNLSSGLGTVQLTETGTYRVSFADPYVEVYAESSSAILRLSSEDAVWIEPGNVGIISVRDGQRAMSAHENPGEVLNAGLGLAVDIATNPALPVGWRCSSQAIKQNEPTGRWLRQLYDWQVVLAMNRTGENLNHAETNCIYDFGSSSQFIGKSEPLNVSKHGSLSIRLRLKIQLQDVTTCGILASECPVMIELMYRTQPTATDPEGEIQFWRHGFYTIRPPSDDSPTACDTCLQEHDKVNAGAWYIYDSGDLFRALPPVRKPYEILHLKLYSSGHAYDALVTDVAVVGRK